MDIIILNLIGAVAISLTVLIVGNKLLMKKALNKFIIPDLTRNGFKLEQVHALGFLRKGQFKKEEVHLRPFMLGYPVFHNYVNLDYSNMNDKSIKQVTAKISVALFIVYKVEYSHPL